MLLLLLQLHTAFPVPGSFAGGKGERACGGGGCAGPDPGTGAGGADVDAGGLARTLFAGATGSHVSR